MGEVGVVSPGQARSGATAALAGLLALAGCSSGSDAPALACPAPAIVDGLASVDRYRTDGGGTRPEDLAYSAALQNIAGGCRAEGADLLVELTVEVVVEVGPAFGGSAVELPYFVAVTAPGGRVLDRRDFTARVVVPAGGRRAGTAESFSQRFVGVGRQGAAGHQILFGFPLPRDEALRRREEG